MISRKPTTPDPFNTEEGRAYEPEFFSLSDDRINAEHQRFRQEMLGILMKNKVDPQEIIQMLICEGFIGFHRLFCGFWKWHKNHYTKVQR